MSAFVKIPLQLLILSTGVLVFCFYLFQTPPMLFNRAYDAQVAAGPHAAEYAGARSGSSMRKWPSGVTRGSGGDRERVSCVGHAGLDDRARGGEVVKKTTGDQRYSDVNYVFPTFVTTHMPMGLVGLMIAAIFAAAMSARPGS